MQKGRYEPAGPSAITCEAGSAGDEMSVVNVYSLAERLRRTSKHHPNNSVFITLMSSKVFVYSLNRLNSFKAVIDSRLYAVEPC